MIIFDSINNLYTHLYPISSQEHIKLTVFSLHTGYQQLK